MDDDEYYDDEGYDDRMITCEPKTQDQIITLFKGMYDNRGTSVMAYYAENTKKKQAIHCGERGMACSAGIRKYSYMSIKPDKAWFTLWFDTNYCTYQEAERYWNFLFSSRWSPWRTITPYMKVIRNSDNQMCAWSLDGLDLPYDVLFNFIIATRIPEEDGNVLRMFNACVDHGMSRYGALWWSSFLTLSNVGVLGLKQDSAHHSFDLYHPGMVSLKRIKNGDPASCGIHYTDNNTPHQYNKIWYTDDPKVIGFQTYRDKRVSFVDTLPNILKPKEPDKSSLKFQKLYDKMFSTKKVRLPDVETFFKNVRKYEAQWKGME